MWGSFDESMRGRYVECRKSFFFFFLSEGIYANDDIGKPEMKMKRMKRSRMMVTIKTIKVM